MGSEARKRPLSVILVAYFGVLQTVHFASILMEAINLRRTGDFLFLAPAPEGGWPGAAEGMLVGMGVADTLLIFGSWVFVFAWFQDRVWARAWGLAVITAFLATALVFAVGTGLAGVWGDHINYWVMSVLFIPVLIFYALEVSELPGL